MDPFSQFVVEMCDLCKRLVKAFLKRQVIYFQLCVLLLYNRALRLRNRALAIRQARLRLRYLHALTEVRRKRNLLQKIEEPRGTHAPNIGEIRERVKR